LPWHAIRLEYSSAHLHAGVGGDCPPQHASPQSSGDDCPGKGSFLGFANRPRLLEFALARYSIEYSWAHLRAGVGGACSRAPPGRSRERLVHKGVPFRACPTVQDRWILPWHDIPSNYSSTHLQAVVGSACPSTHLQAGVGGDCPGKGSFLGFVNRSKRLEFALARYTSRIFVGTPPRRSRERLFQSASGQESGASGPQMCAF
jgi:hypothetical protein